MHSLIPASLKEGFSLFVEQQVKKKHLGLLNFQSLYYKGEMSSILFVLLVIDTIYCLLSSKGTATFFFFFFLIIVEVKLPSPSTKSKIH